MSLPVTFLHINVFTCLVCMYVCIDNRERSTVSVAPFNPITGRPSAERSLVVVVGGGGDSSLLDISDPRSHIKINFEGAGRVEQSGAIKTHRVCTPITV